MKEVPDTVVCPGCDALYSRAPLRPRDVAHCPRCGTELDRHPGQQQRRILPLTVASLIMFAIANLFPIVEIELRGLTSQTTLAGAVVALSRERRPAGFALLVRVMQSLRPWGMIEVFLLGVLVAIVKLSSMATVVPGPALWAFMALTVMLTAVLSFNPGAFWEMSFRPKDGEGASA
jgi:paraquat-inducible protein A